MIQTKQSTASRGEHMSVSRLPSWPHFDEDEILSVTEVLRSGRVNYWTGEEVKNFEKEFANHCGTEYGIALANGTVALELALRSLGIGEGDEVIVTPRTFIASASCIVMMGAVPVFADVDLDSQNITAASIQEVITPRTKAIITVHHAGYPCDMDPIMALAEKHGLVVIEDCAQAHGAKYKGRPVGGLGHVAAFSFCQDKIMTTGGEGGMLVTNSHDVWEQSWSFKDHGKSYDAVYNRQYPAGFRWLHESFGTNWRMTEPQGAIGRIQLKKLPEWHAKRNHNAARLTAHFAGIPALGVTRPPELITHAYYKYYINVMPELLKPNWNRDRILTAITQEGVPCLTGTCPEIYLEKAFELTGLKPRERLPNAMRLGETSLVLLVHPTLTDADIDFAAEVVKGVMSEASA
ncbi:MAG: DegT/DnrJ/EryC1/StrS aminotransferase family protein [Pseudomonadota bacterium]